MIDDLDDTDETALSLGEVAAELDGNRLAHLNRYRPATPPPRGGPIHRA
jgi:hypothetical protein